MTRRKSACSKWTLVLLIVIVCPFVYSRPQDNTVPVESSVSISETVDKPTENPLRYRHKNYTLSLSKIKIPVILDENSFKQIVLRSTDIYNNETHNRNKSTNRRNRLLRKSHNDNPKNTKPPINTNNLRKRKQPSKNTQNKPIIKKVITKWTDSTKYEDMNFNYETTISNEDEKLSLNSLDSTEDYNEVENPNQPTGISKKLVRPKPIKHLLNKIKKIYKKPKPDYSEEEQVYSDNVYIASNYPQTSIKPMYIFNTPSPTPIISNVGNPKPWSRPNFHATYHKHTTKRPVIVTKPPKNHYNYLNSVNNNYPQYPSHGFEVTTFQPINAYTDRIIIRPEEYSASPEECPTIFLTLNNTFQGQGKEACPDLNIAVNTNVINENVVVESDEDEGDGGIFADPFELPFDDESGEDTGNSHDVLDSDENQEQVESESASVESLSYTNYNAATDGSSSELGGQGSASQVLSSYHKPDLLNDEDDTFGISSFYDFFKPAIKALGWLTTVNPFGFGLFSLFIAPIVFLFTGTSGIATLFAPWAYSAREAPKEVHIYRPHWHWDDEIKTWHLHSFPHNRNWNPSLPRSSEERVSKNNNSIKPTVFYRIKEWMKDLTQRLKTSNNSKSTNQHYRKNKRRKREIWTLRIK